MSNFINDLGAVTIILMAFIGIILTAKTIPCFEKGRSQFYLRIIACIGMFIAFGAALLDSYNGGPGLVPPVIGRPAVILLMGVFIAIIIADYQRGKCK